MCRNKVVVFVAGYIFGVITISGIALAQIALRDKVPTCIPGEAIPLGGCVTEIKPMSMPGK